MPMFKRLVVQVHDIPADSPAQADEIARLRANAVNASMRPLGAASAWAVSVADGVSGGDELMELLADAYVLDEVDDDPERHPRLGYVPAERTMLPDRLMAWRDAAVRAALDAMLPPGIDQRIDELTRFLKTVNFNYPDYGKLHDERVRLKQAKHHAEALKRALAT